MLPVLIVAAVLTTLALGIRLFYQRQAERTLDRLFAIDRKAERLAKRLAKRCRRGKLDEALAIYDDLRELVSSTRSVRGLNERLNALDSVIAGLGKRGDPREATYVEELVELARSDAIGSFERLSCSCALATAIDLAADRGELDPALELGHLLIDVAPTASPLDVVARLALGRLEERLRSAGRTSDAAGLHAERERRGLDRDGW